MVRHEENLFHRVINKLVILSIIAIFVMLLIDVLHFFDKLEGVQIPDNVARVINYAIMIIFIIDLVIIFRRRESTKSFFRHNWIDIISCIPFEGVFQALKIFRFLKLTRLTKVTKVAKLSKLSKASKVSKVGRLSRFVNYFGFHMTKLFSREVDLNKHIDVTKDKIFNLKIRKNEFEMKKIIKEIETIEKNNI